MPKLIENLRLRLLEEAGRQLAQNGYSRTTIRSVAAACGVAVGTVYNYFPSKELLIASFLAEEWKDGLSRLPPREPGRPEAWFHALYDALRDFAERHDALFSDADAVKTFAAVFPTRHRQLREQLAALAAPFCGGELFTARFVSEALLTWTMENVPFDRLWPLLARLISDFDPASFKQGGISNHEQL